MRMVRVGPLGGASLCKTLLGSTLGLVTRISDFCNSDAGFSRTSMLDLGPTTQMTITRFRESLLDDKNSLVSISLMTRLLFSAFFPGKLYYSICRSHDI